ncbi:MAG: D-tyrosyl-tRNA(Tyr) deacylase [Planctomycetes bacterium]|nr:D-tyrosyl-tRNA(Tyr) deacylase [Planctomycetota bacterium]
MRVLVQRVQKAHVSVAGETVDAIGTGLLLLVGFCDGDGLDELVWMARKITGLRVFPDDAGQMNLSVQDTNGAILAVSQFTLYGDCRKGRRPSFVSALEPVVANQLFGKFVSQLSEEGNSAVEQGRFGEHMEVHLINDGPVTLWLDRESLS